MKNNFSNIVIVMIICIFFTACGPGQLSTPVIVPVSSESSISTTAGMSTSFPVNAETIDDALGLTSSNAGFMEKIVDLWPAAGPSVSRAAFYPGQSLIVLGTGDSFSSSTLGFGGLSGNTKVLFWDMLTNSNQTAFETGAADANFNTVTVSPDGKWIVFVGIDQFILGALHDNGNDGSLVFTTQAIPMDRPIFPVADLGAIFSADSRRLAIVNGQGDVLVWDLQAGRKLAFFSLGTVDTGSGFFLPNCTNVAIGVAFTSDGKSVLAGCNGGLLSWNLDTQEKTSLDFVNDVPTIFKLSPDGTLLVTAESGGMIHVWGFPAGDLKTELNGHATQINSLEFSPDGSLLASSSAQDKVDVWDAKTWKLLTTLSTSADFLAFTADHKFLLAGTYGQGGSLWGVRPGSLTAERSGVTVLLSEGAASLGSWKELVPAAWLAPEGTFPRHAIRISSEWDVKESCQYGDIGSRRYVDRRQSTVTIQIADLETDANLGEKTFEGSLPDKCPESWTFSGPTFMDYISGDDPDPGSFLPWLQGVMNSLGYP